MIELYEAIGLPVAAYAGAARIPWVTAGWPRARGFGNGKQGPSPKRRDGSVSRVYAFRETTHSAKP